MTAKNRSIATAVLALATLTAYAALSNADEPKPSPTTAPAAASPAPGDKPVGAAPAEPAAVDTTGIPATLDDFAWMVGKWEGQMGPAKTFEQWSAPHAGIMMGVFHLYDGDQTQVMEFMILRQRGNGVEIRFRHFAADLSTWEEKDQSLHLFLDRKSEGMVSFRNPAHDRPRRITMTRRGEDAYHTDIEVVRGDETRLMQVDYKRSP